MLTVSTQDGIYCSIYVVTCCASFYHHHQITWNGFNGHFLWFCCSGKRTTTSLLHDCTVVWCEFLLVIMINIVVEILSSPLSFWLWNKSIWCDCAGMMVKSQQHLVQKRQTTRRRKINTALLQSIYVDWLMLYCWIGQSNAWVHGYSIALLIILCWSLLSVSEQWQSCINVKQIGVLCMVTPSCVMNNVKGLFLKKLIFSSHSVGY